MNIEDFDWTLIKAFLAVAEHGSLSGAARAMNASQPTLGRQIKQLEADLGATLFHRQPRGFELTETGSALMQPAHQMQAAMQQIALTAAGQQETLNGTVRITASVVLSAAHLPPILAQIRQAEPDIALEVAPSDDTRNLLFREADIAIRMYRPTQLDLITQHIGDIPLGVYAAKDYVARCGVPTQQTIMTHDFVGYDANTAIIDGFNAAGFGITRDFFKTRCDDQHAYWEMVCAGCGIGFSQKSIGAADPRVQEIDLGFPLPPLPVWLTAHEVMRQTPRIRRVWDMLADGLRPLVS